MKRALISVSCKDGIVPFAKQLKVLGYEIITTGGTKKVLDKNGVPNISVEELTGFKEILGGRVKTLHPKIHGGLLSLRDNLNHQKDLAEHNIDYIDLVCVNLYPFKDTISKPKVPFKDAIEQIDIGGTTLLRSAAKNYEYVTVVTDSEDYDFVLSELEKYGDTLPTTKQRLSAKAFRRTALYDSVISNYLTQQAEPGNIESMTLSAEFHQALRYGENPHQNAWLYKLNDNPYSILQAELLNGKPLSYNNIQDANAAINIVSEHIEPTAVALKHTNPCGVASAPDIENAFQQAYDCDPVSIFGGVVCVNREVTTALALTLKSIFLEIVIAPAYSKEAISILSNKKNLRLLRLDTNKSQTDTLQYSSVNGGLLVQNTDDYIIPIDALKCVTKHKPTEQDYQHLHFAWKVVKHVKSNAIVVTKGTKTVGIGAGQMNRVGAAKIALEWAKQYGHTEDLILASDAFFPFDDVVKLAELYGVKHIIQPGGSIRDQDSVVACDERHITMTFTGNRHFKH